MTLQALDGDLSGYLDAGEFGRFIMKGKPPPAPSTSKDRMVQRIKEETRQFRQQLADPQGKARQGKATNEKLVRQDIERATAEDVLQLSRIINQELLKLPPDQREWCADCDLPGSPLRRAGSLSAVYTDEF
jgi:hypothetical protein